MEPSGNTNEPTGPVIALSLPVMFIRRLVTRAVIVNEEAVHGKVTAPEEERSIL
jgi:hypothetical protein